MVTVSISETYDLHTEVNKMTLIGIHTPKKELIQKMYPGLCENYRQFRIKSVSVVLSTAQTLPLGVDQIGLDTGQIRPQDMMNPILYKAVSNDSWNTLEYRLKGLMMQDYGAGDDPTAAALSGNMAVVEDDKVTGIADEHGVYYALLSNREGFRIAHPQSGLRMTNLRPIVFEKLYTDAINKYFGNADTSTGIIENTSGTMQILNQGDSFGAVRGRGHPMPWLNTTYLTGINPPAGNTSGTNYQGNGMGNGTPLNFHIQMPDIPPVMLGAIILPPVTATTGILYYRMVCRAVIEFRGVRPMSDITSFTEMSTSVSPYVYHTDYAQQSKEMDAVTDMVDVKNATIEKIMEGR